MGTEVTAERTPASAGEVYGSILRSWPTANKAAVAMLLAQSALETGAWQHMYNWNAGNLAGTGGDAYAMLKAYTGERRPYRAYVNLDDGVHDWLLLLQREPGALSAAMKGDVDGFVDGLVAGHYFEEAPQSYLDAMRSRFVDFAKQIGAPTTQPVSTWIKAAAIVGVPLVAGALTYMILEEQRHLRRGTR
jgi:hypothetical protein